MRRAIGILLACGLTMGTGGASAGADDAVAQTFPPGDPNYSRLLFAPTGRPLEKGDGYFSDYELLFPGGAYGITDNVSIAGGVSVIPGLGLDEQLFYVSPKIGLRTSADRAAVSVGGLFARAGGGEYDQAESLGVGYAVGTFGGRDRSLSVGLGAAKASGELTARYPSLMLGGTTTVSRHVALVGETWLWLGEDFDSASSRSASACASSTTAVRRRRGDPARRPARRGVPAALALRHLSLREKRRGPLKRARVSSRAAGTG